VPAVALATQLQLSLSIQQIHLKMLIYLTLNTTAQFSNANHFLSYHQSDRPALCKIIITTN